MTPLQLKWMLTGLLGGTGCGLAGFILVSLNLPFMGICLAHAALAGAVLAYFIGAPRPRYGVGCIPRDRPSYRPVIR